MSGTQKTIKYVAIGIALALALFIIGSIVRVGLFMTGFTGGSNTTFTESWDFQDGIDQIYIESISDIKIVEGDSFKVFAQNTPDSIRVSETTSGTISITMDTEFWNTVVQAFTSKHNRIGTITVTVPKGRNLREIEIKNMIGDIHVEDILVEHLMIEAGAGNLTLETVVSGKGFVKAGVGELKVVNSDIKNTKFDSGVGDVHYEGILKGDCEINAGVGDVVLKLEGAKEDYEIEIDAGIGTARIDDKKVSKDFESDSRSEHSISVEAGIGDVTINFH